MTGELEWQGFDQRRQRDRPQHPNSKPGVPAPDPREGGGASATPGPRSWAATIQVTTDGRGAIDLLPSPYFVLRICFTSQ
jgi:hypothetical protein